jgi:hypothetical protein
VPLPVQLPGRDISGPEHRERIGMVVEFLQSRAGRV